MSLVNKLRKYKPIWVHAVAWAIFLAAGAIQAIVMKDDYIFNLLDIIATATPIIFGFYARFYILDILLDKNNPRKAWLIPFAELGLFSIYLVLFYYDRYTIEPIINPKFPMPPFKLSKHIVSVFWIYFLYGIYAQGYYFYVQAVRREKQLRNVELKQLQMEQNRLQSEYAFLNAQINPHFLYNTLNFFYAKSLSCSNELSEGILTLSEIMRYSLEPNESMDGKVALSKEVEHLKNVIKINQLRFSNKLHLDFVIRGDISSIRIIPLVLITLVENAFKHGDFTDPQHPVRLYLEVNEDQTRFHFATYNKLKSGPRELSHGIGIENIRKRLHWNYQDQYTFETGEVNNDRAFYSATLTIHFQATRDRIHKTNVSGEIGFNLKPGLQ